jgi:serine protease SohB
MTEVLIFFAKFAISFLFIAALILIIAVLVFKSTHRPEIELESLNQKYNDLKTALQSMTLSRGDLKKERKKQKKEAKEAKESDDKVKHVFVLNFDGDLRASQIENLREEITAILQVASPDDEVVLKLESPGGVVHSYGHAASQLQRIRDHKIFLTVCVDEVAASGGYMMACVGNQILAAPFAIVGSIGVLAQVPNLNRLLKKHDVDFKEYTAGEFKRTVTVLGEITPQKEQKFLERIQDTHQLFKQFVLNHRPQLDLNLVATGDYWFGEEALKLGLVDQLRTSDDYLLRKVAEKAQIISVKIEHKKPLADKLSNLLGKSAKKVFETALQTNNNLKFP